MAQAIRAQPDGPKTSLQSRGKLCLFHLRYL